MCDALSRNLPGELRAILAHCLAHARRQFVNVYEGFPEPCRHLLEALGAVYRNEALAREHRAGAEPATEGSCPREGEPVPAQAQEHGPCRRITRPWEPGRSTSLGIHPDHARHARRITFCIHAGRTRLSVQFPAILEKRMIHH